VIRVVSRKRIQVFVGSLSAALVMSVIAGLPPLRAAARQMQAVPTITIHSFRIRITTHQLNDRHYPPGDALHERWDTTTTKSLVLVRAAPLKSGASSWQAAEDTSVVDRVRPPHLRTSKVVVDAHGHICTQHGAAWACFSLMYDPGDLIWIDINEIVPLAQPFPQATLTQGAPTAPVQRLGPARRHGHQCIGFRVRDNGYVDVHTTTLWIDQGTGLPVEEDGVAITPASQVTSAVTETATAVWSDWNNPRLRMPAIPAAACRRPYCLGRLAL
jgi:hypothetical protein